MLASVDQNNAPDNLSDMFSSELPNSPAALSDNLGSATIVNPFLPMFPAALGPDIFTPGNAVKAGIHTGVDKDALPGGNIFQNLPEARPHFDGDEKLAHASSQFVRGSLAAGISSPAPKGASVSTVAPQVHGGLAQTHDVAGASMAHAIYAPDDMRVDDVTNKAANPQVPSRSLVSQAAHAVNAHGRQCVFISMSLVFRFFYKCRAIASSGSVVWKVDVFSMRV